MEYLLTIVIPTYNSQYYIKRLLDKLQKQIRDDIQVCIVDDGSKDNTYQVLQSLKLNSNFEIYSLAHAGVSNARNYGIKKAKGKYICFVDSDDDVRPNFVSTFLKYYRYNYDTIIMDSDKAIVPENQIYSYVQYKYLFTGLKNNRYFVTPGIHSKFYKKTLITNNQINFCKKLRIGEDVIFNINSILNSNNVFLTNDHIYNYLEPHTMNKFRVDRVENELLFQKLLNYVLSEYKYKMNVIEYYKVHGIIFLIKDYYSYSPSKDHYLSVFMRARELKKITDEKYYQYLNLDVQNLGLGQEEKILYSLVRHRKYYLCLVLDKSARILKSVMKKEWK